MNYVKEQIKKILARVVYKCYRYNFFKMPHEISVMSVDETIHELRTTNKSLVRFGDGEMLIIRGGNIAFQNSFLYNSKCRQQVSQT